MRAALLLSFLVLLPSSGALADYSPPPLSELVLASDAIVVGEITALGAETFTLRVEDVIAGAIAGAALEVVRFQDWTCSTRWAPYAVGQRALLFLSRHEGRWRIVSPGGEGEMPIEAGRVYLDAFYGELTPAGTASNATLPVQGGRFVGYALDVRVLVAALREARACYVAEVDPQYGTVTSSRASCPAERLGAASAASPTGAALFRVLAATAR